MSGNQSMGNRRKESMPSSAMARNNIATATGRRVDRLDKDMARYSDRGRG